jgi:protease YdgD
VTLRTLILVALVALLPAVVSAQSTGLARLTDRDDLLGWEAVGRLDMRGSGYCTGTLIASDLVLTAAHCVFDKGSNALLSPGDMTFRAGLRDGVAIAERTVFQIAAHPEYVPGGERTLDQIRHDVALLRLSAPVVSTDADPFVLHQGKVGGDTVSVASYGQGRSEALSRQRKCTMLAADRDLMAFDCDVTFGSSGAPVFAHDRSRGRILSIISGGGTVDGQDVALGMALPDVVAELKAKLRALPGARPAQVRRLTVGGDKGGTGAKFVKP